MRDLGMKHHWRTRGIVLTAIAVIAAAVWFGGKAQSNASKEGAEEVATSQQLLTARLGSCHRAMPEPWRTRSAE